MSLHASSIPRLTSTPSTSVKPVKQRLEVGQRVVVNGCKRGVLRYIGFTKFAAGLWGGVELDQPLGKNDGSVQGVRYFTCEPRFGSFAPSDKIMLETEFDDEAQKKKLPYRPNIASSLRHLRNGSLRDSQESLNSLCSFQSNTSRRKLSQSSMSTMLTNPVAEAIKVSMKEKDHHLEQLLKERDMEREELSRLTELYEKAAEDSARIQEASEQEIANLHSQLDGALKAKSIAEQESKKWFQSFEAEKQRYEDMQFKLEEDLCAMVDTKTNALEKEFQAATLKCQALETEKERIRLSFEASLAAKEQQLAAIQSEREVLIKRLEEKTEEKEFVLAPEGPGDDVQEIKKRLEQFEEDAKAAASREAALQNKFSDMVQEYTAKISDLQARLDAAVTLKSAEDSSLKKEESNSALLIKQKDDQIAAFMKRLASMEEATTALEQELKESRSLANTWQARNEVLSKQVRLLSTQLQVHNEQKEHADKEAQTDIVPEKAKVPSDDCAKIAFLNSVIAELQRKNDELMKFKKHDEEDVFDFSNMKSLLPSLPAPRQYCDICEVFDQHDTIDCPFDEHEIDTHSHFDGQRGGLRLFCDICEGYA